VTEEVIKEVDLLEKIRKSAVKDNEIVTAIGEMK